MINRYAGCMTWLGLLYALACPCAGQPAKERLLFGASMGNYWPGNVETDIRFFQLMKDAGITHTGLGFNWDNIEKQRGKYNWAPWD